MSDTDQQVGSVVAEPVPMNPSDGIPQQSSADILLQKAVDKGLSVETMERLVALRKELRAEQAKEAYDDAMAKMQGEIPVIEKTKKVYNKPPNDKTVRYCYAPLDSIVSQVKPFLAKFGFSYSITTDQSDPKMVVAICTVKHKMGHSEVSSFAIPIDNASAMSAPQRFAAALSFAKRYAFSNAFGIMTCDDDTDANIDEDEIIVVTSKASEGPRPQLVVPQKVIEPKQGLGGKYVIKDPEAPASPAQIAAVTHARSKYGMTEEAFLLAYGITEMKQLKKGQASKLIDEFKKRVADGERWSDPSLPTIQIDDENVFDDTNIDMTKPPASSVHTGEVVDAPMKAAVSQVASNMASG